MESEFLNAIKILGPYVEKGIIIPMLIYGFMYVKNNFILFEHRLKKIEEKLEKMEGKSCNCSQDRIPTIDRRVIGKHN